MPSMNWRMFPPTSPAQQARVANGRTYKGQAGTAISVPEHDGQVLQANGWTYLCPSAPTAARPSGRLGVYANLPGALLYDETLAKIIATDGTTWRDPVTGAAV